MDDMQILGYAVWAVVTLGAFVAVIAKFTTPINEVRLAIQKLIDRLDSMKEADDKRDQTLKEHTDQIDKLQNRVGTVETKMQLYHKE